ncbi:unnamed protein product [Protopolystoma xenopodis]|uniref:Uncharacterized protein n=1 Tax=Protopolystoma xenopodis TaxID=117903 RepID=A0A3S5FH21_9PLAT|nr:unnamed protein product [Protopolystoma xenopodis]
MYDLFDSQRSCTCSVRKSPILRVLWSIRVDAGLAHLGHSVALASLARLSHLPGVHVG